MADELSNFYAEIAAAEATLEPSRSSEGARVDVAKGPEPQEREEKEGEGQGTVGAGAHGSDKAEDDALAGFYAEIAKFDSHAATGMAVGGEKGAAAVTAPLAPPPRPPPATAIVTKKPATISAPPVRASSALEEGKEAKLAKPLGPSQPPPPGKAVPPPPPSKGATAPGGAGNTEKDNSKKIGVIRQAAGSKWVDTKLVEWPDNDFRIFVGNLGGEVNDALLAKTFSKYASFHKARVVKNPRDNKSKGYGFVSILDPRDGAQALRELHGQYIGNRPCQLKRCKDTRTVTDAKGRIKKRTVNIKERDEEDHIRAPKFQKQ